MISKDSVVDENSWFKPNIKHPYYTSKALAEIEAWRFYFESKGKLNLTVINPALVLGKYLTPNFTASAGILKRLFTH